MNDLVDWDGKLVPYYEVTRKTVEAQELANGNKKERCLNLATSTTRCFYEGSREEPVPDWCGIAMLIDRARRGYISEDKHIKLMDSQFIAGVKAGWNAAHSDNPEKKKKAIYDACGR